LLALLKLQKEQQNIEKVTDQSGPYGGLAGRICIPLLPFSISYIHFCSEGVSDEKAFG
jgi:hypothetical protein